MTGNLRISRLGWVQCAACCVAQVWMLTGCTTTRALEIEAGSPTHQAAQVLKAIDEATMGSLTRGADVRILPERPYLAVDDALSWRIRNRLKNPDPISASEVEEVVLAAGSLASEERSRRARGLGHVELAEAEAYPELAAARQWIDRGQIAALGPHRSTYHAPDEGNWNADAVGSLGREASEALLSRCLETIKAESSAQWRRNYLKSLVGEAPVSIKQRGRTARRLLTAPLAPFVYGWMGYHVLTEYRGPNDVNWGAVRVYEPSTSRDRATAAHLADATESELAAFFAPRIVQQRTEDADYDPAIDHPGALDLVMREPASPEVFVDPERPVIYYDIGEARIDGIRYRQIVYTIWYPMHPPSKPNDPEAGPIEGLMMRVTLSSENRPLCFEGVYACGCYHRIYPTRELEEAWNELHPLAGGTSPQAMARPRRWKIDGILPETAGGFDPAQPHPTVWIYAGFHMIGRIAAEPAPMPPASPRVPIGLELYEKLKRLPYGERNASAFGRDGLVRGADRPEARLLYPTGIYHAGTPRQRGTHLIHFDQYDFDNPALLGELLDWPTLALRPDTVLLGYRGGEGTPTNGWAGAIVGIAWPGYSLRIP